MANRLNTYVDCFVDGVTPDHIFNPRDGTEFLGDQEFISLLAPETNKVRLLVGSHYNTKNNFLYMGINRFTGTKRHTMRYMGGGIYETTKAIPGLTDWLTWDSGGWVVFNFEIATEHQYHNFINQPSIEYSLSFDHYLNSFYLAGV